MLAEIDLLPKRHGLLADSRYPAGALVVWLAEQEPVMGPKWQEVGRVLGLETWHWWEAPGQRLYAGVPLAHSRLGEPRGRSLLLTSRPDAQEFGSVENRVRYDLGLSIDDWLPLLLLTEAATVVGNESGRLRAKLDRRAKARLGWLRLFGLGPLVASLYECQYRLERIRQAARIDTNHGFWQFPAFVSRPPVPASAPASGTKSRLRRLRLALSGGGDSRATAGLTLRKAELDRLAWIAREALNEVGLSLKRARLIADIRSANALLVLTAVLAALTLLLVLRGR
jgi:hypothetical protein